MKVFVGWLPLEEDGSARRGPASQRWYEKTKRLGPIKLYQTKKRAEGLSSTGKAVEVFYEQD